MSKSPLQIFDDNQTYPATSPALAAIATEGTLRFWRHVGRGPSYVKVSPGRQGRVIYLGADLNSFLAERRVKVSA